MKYVYIGLLAWIHWKQNLAENNNYAWIQIEKDQDGLWTAKLENVGQVFQDAPSVRSSLSYDY